jgi:integration host factor subunit alpha
MIAQLIEWEGRVGKTLTRAEIVDALGREVGLSLNECSDLLEAMLDEIVASLERDELVKLARFGNFAVRSKRPRVGRNPKTGVEAEITARKVVSFKPSQILRARVEAAD